MAVITQTHIITENESGLPVKHIVRGVMQVSNTRFSRMKFNGGVLVDGIVAYANDIVRLGQTVTLLEEERAAYTPEGYHCPVPIVYEDAHLYIVNKPAPMPCQTGTHKLATTLENAMFTHFSEPENFIFRPVNRLDKGTGGLMVIAKSGHVHALLQKQLHTDTFRRTYLAITDGVPEAEEGVITLKIGREEGSVVKRAITDNGRQAETHYKVLKKSNGRALVWLELKTGRTHQIRVHLSALGCPVTGDYLYGTELTCLGGRFALHSGYVSFVHPVTKESVVREAPLPEALLGLLGGDVPESGMARQQRRECPCPEGACKAHD